MGGRVEQGSRAVEGDGDGWERLGAGTLKLPDVVRSWKAVVAEDKKVKQIVVTRMLKNMGIQVRNNPSNLRPL